MESEILHLTDKCIWVFGDAGYLGRAMAAGIAGSFYGYLLY